MIIESWNEEIGAIPFAIKLSCELNSMYNKRSKHETDVEDCGSIHVY